MMDLTGKLQDQVPMMDKPLLLERLARRDRRVLPRLLSLVESGEAPSIDETPLVNCTDSATLVVGITGSGGAGKSTLVGQLTRHLRESDKTVALLACDPQSPISGGAFLGDRIRVMDLANKGDPADEGVFFRSFSTRGATGGIADAIRPAIDWLRVFRFDVVLIETVGVGQDQFAIRPLVERLVLLVTPGSGDEVQWEKAGLIELADIVAVNKCDQSGAEQVIADLKSSLSLVSGSKPPPVLSVTATTGAGVPELWKTISG